MSYVEEYVKRLEQIQAQNIMGQVTASLGKPANPTDFANLILQKARSDWSVKYTGGPEQKQNKGGLSPKSFALGLLDKLARPGYAVANAEDVAFNKPGAGLGDVVKAFGRGFAAKDKTSYIDVLQHQHENHVKNSDEYQRILGQYGQGEADAYAKNQIKNDFSDVAGGLAVDFVQDPLNLVGAGLITKPLKAVKGISKAATEASDLEHAGATLARETATSAATGAPEATATVAEKSPGLSPELLDKVKAAQGDASQVDFPLQTGKFGSNRRPPTKLVEGQKVSADYSFAKSLQQEPRFANLHDVFNRDLRQSDFQDLQKARIQHETAQIVDQTGKGNPSALDFITNKNIDPLPPVARSHVESSVNHIIHEIDNAIPDVVKAKAAGKQFRWPVNNAPTQNNLSNRLSRIVHGDFGGGRRTIPSDQVPAAYDHYLNMLKNSEESLVTLGRAEKSDKYYPRGGIKPDSPYLRLSDVLATLPRELAQGAIFGSKTEKVLPSIILKAVTGSSAALGKIAKTNRPLFDAIQNTDWAPLMVKEYATRTIDAANAAHETTDSVANFIATKFADPNASDVNKAAAMDAAVKAGKDAFRKEMPAAKSSLGQMLDGLRQSIPNPLPDPADAIIEANKHKLAAGVFSAKNGQKVAQGPRIATQKAVIEDVTGSTAREAAVDLYKAEASAEGGIFTTVGKWFNPAFGYKDLRQLLLKNISVRKTSATTRAHEIIKVFRQVPEAEHMHFWDEVRGVMIDPAPQHAAPVAQLQKMLQNLFGDSGLAEKFAGNTAIARAGINVDHLNQHLRIVGVKDFQFVRDVPDPLDPSKMVRLNPDQVLDTWKTYMPKDSKSLKRFVYNLSQAVENSMVEYSTFSNLGALYGSKVGSAGTIAVTGMHSAIDNMYFPKEMVSQIGAMARGIDDMYKPIADSELMRLYDIGLRTWKTGVTIYSPSHHIRNMVGDMFTAWLDGVSNPAYYTKSSQIILHNRHRYSDMRAGSNPLKDILGDTAEADNIAAIIGQSQTKRIPKGTRVIATAKIGGKSYPMTIDQVYQMGFRHGLFPHSSIVEDLPGSETLMETIATNFPKAGRVVQPFGGNVAKGVKNLAETREHYVRIAHWLHALEHTKANSLEDLFQKSASRVRKYHPDGLDLTLTEKKVFRRLIPFYSWNRKAIPLIVEGIAMHPAKILAYPKVAGATQEYQGIDSSISDPWPDDQLFPDWLSSKVIGPTIPADSSFARLLSRSPAEVGYGVVNPGNPATDILEQFFNNPIQGVANAATPALKLPAELATGHQIQSGAPIGDKTQYIDKNVPMLSTISRLTNGAVGTGVVQGGDLKNKETSPYNPAGLINYLTGAGIIDTGRYIKGGQFDLRDKLRKQKQNGSQ